jgi:excisionase family DNA binding protein
VSCWRLGSPSVAWPDRHGGAAKEVLILAELAERLRVPTDEIRVRAARANLPARRFGDEWRFVRATVLAWLGSQRGSLEDAERRDEPR